MQSHAIRSKHSRERLQPPTTVDMLIISAKNLKYKCNVDAMTMENDLECWCMIRDKLKLLNPKSEIPCMS